MKSCYRYDHQNDTWTNFTQLNHPRDFFASSLLSNDEWWLTGGEISELSTDLLVSGNTFMIESVQLPERMRYHTMIRVNETSVVFVGNDYYSTNTYIYDKTSQSFTELPSLSQGRYWPQAGKVYV